MRQISEETILSVDSFMAYLSNEQVISLANRSKEKQPHLQLYFHSFIDSHATPKELAVLDVLLIYMIRVYEYEYGEIAEIQNEIIRANDDKIFSFIQTEKKRNSLSKIHKEIKKQASQKEFIYFLESIVDGESHFTNPFRDGIKPYVKVGIYSLMIIQNGILENNNQ